MTKKITYGCGDTNWKDKLTSYNGKNITYDAIGNPLNDGTYTYTWQQGRQLSGMSGNGKTINYKYNEDGIRTQKTVNGVTTNYTLNGDEVTSESDGTNTIYYQYGTSNNVLKMNLNGNNYYYIRNAQGDIIGLIDSTGTQVVSYTYDTWGKLISISGSLKDTVGVLNPYRYRGYRYDTETGFYYLQSRYYNPEWGRFINADDTDQLDDTNEDLLDYNMFTYCNNNSVNKADNDGRFAYALYFVPGIGAVLLGITAVGFAAYGTYKILSRVRNRIRNYNFASKIRSKSPPARRVKCKSRKEAKQRATRAGKGRKPRGPENHGGGWHYHPNVPKAQRTTPKGYSSHDHFYYY